MSERGYDPRAIANMIWTFGRADGRNFSNVSIQKLLYFSHASFLVKYNRPLVDSAFEAWEYGPVCRPVYDALKAYGRQPITELIEKHNIFTGELSSIDSPGDRYVISHLTQVVEHLGQLSPSALIELSHKKGSAWDIVWNKGKTSVTLNNRISDELTKSTYSKLKLGLGASNTKDRQYDIEATPFNGYSNSKHNSPSN